MKAKITWVLIADRQRAFVLQSNKLGGGLTLVENAQWTVGPPAKATDQPGRAFSSFGSARSAMEPHQTSQSPEELFAKKLAIELASAHKSGRFDQFVLCAGPKMLSALADATGPILGGYLKAQVQKNLVNTPIKDIVSHFEEVLLI